MTEEEVGPRIQFYKELIEITQSGTPLIDHIITGDEIGYVQWDLSTKR